MRKANIAALLSLAVAFLIPPLIMAESIIDTITKQNQAAQGCNLTVNVDDRGDWIKLTVSIPKDDKRLERLFSSHFVLGTNGSPRPWRVMVPINISEKSDGSRTFEVSVQKDRLHDSFIEFAIKWPDPKLSSLDGCYLNLESYFVEK